MNVHPLREAAGPGPVGGRRTGPAPAVCQAAVADLDRVGEGAGLDLAELAAGGLTVLASVEHDLDLEGLVLPGAHARAQRLGDLGGDLDQEHLRLAAGNRVVRDRDLEAAARDRAAREAEVDLRGLD